MSQSFTLAQVQVALHLEQFDIHNAHRRMAPEPRGVRLDVQQKTCAPKQAAVLVLLFPSDGYGLSLVLVRRTVNEHDKHSGQISLPGGSQEPGETVEQTALRETVEEVGAVGPVKIIGRLASLYIPPSDFDVHPVVGFVATHPFWCPDPREVAEIVECPLVWLLDDARKITEYWPYGTLTLKVPWYNINGHKVWGATAIILSELEQRLKQVSG